MNILQIIPSLDIGGAEVLVAKMAIFLKKIGCNVTILVFVPTDNYLVDLLRQNEVEIVVSPQKKMPIFGQFYSPYNFIFINKYIENHRFDIIHAHLTPAQVSMAIVRLIYKNKIPLITTEHSTYNRRRKMIFKLFDYVLYSQFDRIVAISYATKKELVKWVPGAVSRCCIIHNGIDIGDFQNPSKAERRVQKEGLHILSIGRLHSQKGQDILLRAFAFTNGMYLYLVGDGLLRKKMEGLVKKLNIEEKVFFLGNRSDIPDLLMNADIYVQPSLSEGFGIATLEAMASGLPVVVSNVPGLADIVGEAGITFPPGDVKKLASILILLGSDVSLRNKLSDLAKQRSTLFSLKSSVNEYMVLYKDVLRNT